MEQRTDWPFGPALERHRVAAGLSVKAAARRTQGQVSDGRWYQLESGYQQIKGQHIPIGTTAATVAAAAIAVGWDRDEALRTAGFDPVDYRPPREDRPLKDIPTEELVAQIERLWAELRRRIPTDEPLEGAPAGIFGPKTKPEPLVEQLVGLPARRFAAVFADRPHRCE